MKNLVGQYPQADQARLNSAADTWRLPFWDWAAKKPNPSGPPSLNVPQIVKLPNVEVYPPQGGKKTIPNPMYKFSMPNKTPMGQHGVDLEFPVSDDFTVKFGDCVGTSRYATTAEVDQWVQGTENNDSIVATLRNPNSDPDDWPANLGTLADGVYRLFTAEYMSNYEAFATSRYGPNPTPQDYASLEAVHNAIHDMTGGFSSTFGHMANVPVAAFDPIFWLHHW